MQIFNDKQNKFMGKLILLMGIYIIISALPIAYWQSFILEHYPHKYELFKDTIVRYSWIKNILIAVLRFGVIFCFIKLRETKDTKKIYRILMWTEIGLTVFSYVYSGVITSIARSSAYLMNSGRDNIKLLNSISQILYYLTVFLPLPIYISILIKEKLKYNWMVIGNLTSIILSIISIIILKVRNSMMLSVDMFEKNYPLLSIFADNNVLRILRGYLWIIGIIVMVIIYKQNNLKNKE